MFAATFCTTGQVNVISYKSRPNAKDFIQVEIVVEKNSQKIILIGKVIYLSYHKYTPSLYSVYLLLFRFLLDREAVNGATKVPCS